MENEKNARVIELEDLWSVLIHRLPVILICAVLCVALAVLYNNVMIRPEYNSTATLYILKQDNPRDYSYTQQDFTLAMNLVNDCTYMIKSHAVLDDVIEELDLNMTYKELEKKISTRNPENTRILEVSVRTADPEQSKQIVDSVCKTAAAKIENAVGADQVSVYDKGTLESKPCNRFGASVYVIAAVAGALLAYVLCLILYMVDDKIATEEDVSKYLEVSVLGVIPNNSDRANKRGNKYYKASGAPQKTSKRKKR